MTPRIAIFTDDPGWHGEQLAAAFAARGIEAVFVDLQDCRVDLVNGVDGLVIPGFETRLPEGAFVRSVPGGTLEQVVLRLDVLHALAAIGIPVYNSGRAVEKSVDKAMTTLLLARASVPTPPTWVTEAEPVAQAVLRREAAAGRRVVLKPLFGSMGRGLRRLDGPGDLPPAGDYAGVYYLQRYIDTGEGNWHDWRVLVIGGRARAAMCRYGASWINNVAQGARCEAAAIDADLATLAEAATAALDMDYAGVDILRGADGRAVVIEVNSIPAWKGLQSVWDEDIARLLVDDFLARRLLAGRLAAVAP